MEYYELQQLWDNKDEPKVDLELNQKAFSELVKNKIHGNLGDIKWSGIIEIVITIFWLNFLVPIILDHIHDIGILVSGIVLFLLSIYSLILEINKLYLISSIKYDYSIIHTQGKIERLKFIENLDLNSLYFIIPMSFIPFLIVLGEGVLHIDLEEIGLGATEMIEAVLGSIIVAVVVVFFLRKFELKKLNDSLEFIRGLEEGR
ncbi:MAG: hypothetical protein ACJA01_002196 [Saprospiraceae bacterium]|jgi:hypothetical protein